MPQKVYIFYLSKNYELSFTLNLLKINITLFVVNNKKVKNTDKTMYIFLCNWHLFLFK